MSKTKPNHSLLRRIPKEEREAVAKLIREAIAEEHLDKLRADIAADPEGWSTVYHFGGGRDIRNLLRFLGFAEKWSKLSPRRRDGADIVLDQVWAPLVELAIMGDDPRSRTKKSGVRSRADLRWRARRRAYGQASAASRGQEASQDDLAFA